VSFQLAIPARDHAGRLRNVPAPGVFKQRLDCRLKAELRPRWFRTSPKTELDFGSGQGARQGARQGLIMPYFAILSENNKKGKS